MELWTIILSFWLTTWLMLVWKTYSISMHMIENHPNGTKITDYRKTHFIIYIVGVFFITPFIWQVAIFERSKRSFIIAYVNAILGR